MLLYKEPALESRNTDFKPTFTSPPLHFADQWQQKRQTKAKQLPISEKKTNRKRCSYLDIE